MILNTKDMEIQYVKMTEENKNEFGYIPNYDELIAEAPNAEMVAKWEQCRELHEKKSEKKTLNTQPLLLTAFT